MGSIFLVNFTQMDYSLKVLLTYSRLSTPSQLSALFKQWKHQSNIIDLLMLSLEACKALILEKKLTAELLDHIS